MKKTTFYLIPLTLFCFTLLFSCGDDPVTPAVEICNNNIDDDGDGDVDCDDGDCATFAACLIPAEICGNGIDDDMDGDTDCDDSDCDAESDCIDEICNNGLDDDGDGNIDCDDNECATAAGCFEICDNGIDDDNNGDIDCFDSACTGFSEAIYTGTFIGNYDITLPIIGTVPAPRPDTVDLAMGSSMTDLILEVTSSSLAFSNLSAAITSCNTIDLEDGIVVAVLPVTAADTFFNVSLGDNSTVTISENLDTIRIDFNDIVIQDGTKNVFPFSVTNYPIMDVAIRSNADGSIRQ